MMRPLPYSFSLKLLGTFVTFAQLPDPSASCSINCRQGLLTLLYPGSLSDGQPTQANSLPHTEENLKVEQDT